MLIGVITGLCFIVMKWMFIVMTLYTKGVGLIDANGEFNFWRFGNCPMHACNDLANHL
jgi:hypothetical protein